MKETNYQFAPMRTYSASKTNKKYREITSFISQNVNRRCFVMTGCILDEILSKIRKECERLDNLYPSSYSLRADYVGSAEKDYTFTIIAKKENSSPVLILEINCFKVNGCIKH